MTSAWAQKGGTAKHTSNPVLNLQSQGTGGLSVSFVNLSDGIGVAAQHELNLGRVSYAGRPQIPNEQARILPDRLLVSTNLGLSIQDFTGHFATVTLSASLVYPDINHVLRLDGVRLSAVPQVVQGRVPTNKISAHRLEIEVPTSLTEKDAAVHNSIIFQVIPN